MATVPPTTSSAEVYYPDSDGQPLGESPLHILNLRYVIEPLEIRFGSDPYVFLATNMFVYYVEGNPRRHVSPDVFVVRGIPSQAVSHRRRYLLWMEGKAPDLIIELTSESTRDEDVEGKMRLYRDVLRVPEYFLFDPEGEYLDPRLPGYRLAEGQYVPVEAVGDRLPSEVLGLHLEGDGDLLRFWDPVAGRRLPIPPEEREQAADALHREQEARRREEERRRQEEDGRRHEEQARRREEHARRREEQARRHEEQLRRREEQARQQAEAEVERLRREIEELRRQNPGPS
jgi:Uma2 family endonuclease